MLHTYLTVFISSDIDDISESPPTIAVDSSNSEGVVGVRSESTGSEGLIHHLPKDSNPSPQFLKVHLITSDDPITLNAVYSIPGHNDTSGGSGRNHIARSSSGCYTLGQSNNSSRYNFPHWMWCDKGNQKLSMSPVASYHGIQSGWLEVTILILPCYYMLVSTYIFVHVLSVCRGYEYFTLSLL